MPIAIPLPDLSGYTKTQVQDTSQAGATSLSGYDTSGFASGDFFVVGAVGTNGCEQSKITASPTTTVFTVSALSYPHMTGEDIAWSPMDTFKLYKNGTLLTTLNINWNQPTTNYFDINGLSTDSYYAVPVNSVNGWAGPASPTITGTGYEDYQLYQIRKNIRTTLRDNGPIYKFKTAELNIWINQSYKAMQRVAVNINKNWFMKDTAILPFTSGIQEYALPTDCKFPLYLWVSASGTSTDLYSVVFDKMQRVFDVQYQVPNNYPLGNSQYQSRAYLAGQSIGFLPIATSGGYKLRYVPTSLTLVSDSDSLASPLNEYSDYILDGVLSKALRKDDPALAEQYRVDFMNDLLLMGGELSKRQNASDTLVHTSDNTYSEAFIDDSYPSAVYNSD